LCYFKVAALLVKLVRCGDYVPFPFAAVPLAGGVNVLNVQRTVQLLITIFTLQEQGPALLVCKYT
jgi:hypothetical protein